MQRTFSFILTKLLIRKGIYDSKQTKWSTIHKIEVISVILAYKYCTTAENAVPKRNFSFGSSQWGVFRFIMVYLIKKYTKLTIESVR